MFKKKSFLLLLCSICILCLFASCSASMESAPNDSKGDWNGSGFSEDAVMDGESTGGTEAPESTQKLIQNLYLTIEVDEVEVSYEKILNKALSLGGYEFSRDYSKSGDYHSLHAVLKVPAKELQTFSKDMELIGNILNNQLTSEDISESYYDAKTRLTNMEKTLEKYYEFLEQATTLEEQLSITKQIDELTYQIEALKGRISKWDNQVDYATVSIRIYEYDDPSIKKEEIQWNSLSLDDMWYLIKSGFMGVTSFVVSALQWILIILASTSVITVPVLILVLSLVARARKKKKAKKEAESEEKK